MQLLGRRSEESNGVDLLGIIDEDVPKMTDFGLPLPHMGWNRVYPQAGNRLFPGIEDGEKAEHVSPACSALIMTLNL